jgi:hypothetical protein
MQARRRAPDVPYCHREKWDGSGNPRGLRGEQMPLAAQLFAVADVWDALRSDRPYRPAWPEGRVLDHMARLSGSPGGRTCSRVVPTRPGQAAESLEKQAGPVWLNRQRLAARTRCVRKGTRPLPSPRR